MKWYNITRTKRGTEVISGLFKYCAQVELGTEKLVLITDGGLAWAKISQKGARALFDLGDPLDEEIAAEVQKNYEISAYRKD